MKPSWSVGLAVGLLIYAFAAMFSANEVGFVGETDIGWALARPPTVLVGFSPLQRSELAPIGPLEARESRPTEALRIGDSFLPLAINDYTGGVSDWPARMARGATGLRQAGLATNLALGGLLLYLAHRFLRFHGTPTAAGAVALLLGSDWCFVFFKRVLGGTEILLQAAGLLVLWAIWSRRWKGGQHGTLALAAGVGLGLQAKATFLGTLVAFLVAAVLTRWDRPRVNPPRRVHWGWLAGIVIACVSPLMIANAHELHDLALPEGRLVPHIVSHDHLALQWGRIALGNTMGRESWLNLARFLGNPLGWLGDAWATDRREAFAPIRAAGLAFVAWGTVLEWVRRTASPSAALLRFLSLAVPLQLLALSLLNRDLHHLAQASVPLALWSALALDRVAANFAPPRSWLRASILAFFCLPAMLSGIWQLRDTDSLVRTARAHLFSRNGQEELAEMLVKSHAARVVTTSYEAYGMLDELLPTVAFEHAWGAVSHGSRTVAGLREIVGCDYYLSLRGSAPFVYDWRADGVGTEVASLHDRSGPWAVLFAGDCGGSAREPAQP